MVRDYMRPLKPLTNWGTFGNFCGNWGWMLGLLGHLTPGGGTEKQLAGDVQRLHGDPFACATWRPTASCWRPSRVQDVARWRQPVSDGHNRRRWWPLQDRRRSHGRGTNHRDTGGTPLRRTSGSAASATHRSTNKMQRRRLRGRRYEETNDWAPLNPV